MKPRDWFSVGIRLFGVWMLLTCMEDLRTIAGILSHLFNPLRTSTSAYAMQAIIDGVVGIYLLGGAPLLSAFAFPRRKANTCESCGYDLTGNTTGMCPECGTQIARPPAHEPLP